MRTRLSEQMLRELTSVQDRRLRRKMLSHSMMRSLLSAFIAVSYYLALSTNAFGQDLTLGAITGASATDDFQQSNASQWFMVGPKLELGLSDHFSLEADTIYRRIRFKQLIVPGSPLLNGATLQSLGPFTSDVSSWQFSWLAKYRIGERRRRPFVELGTSFRPQGNRKDQTGITIGSGAEIPLRRVNIAPTIRYTRWLKNENVGAVSNQLQFLVGVHEPSDSMQPRVFGRNVSLGIVSAFGLTDLLQERLDLVSRSAAVNPDQNMVIGGLMVEVPVYRRLLVEVQGLYRPAHTMNGSILPDGSVRNLSRSAFLVWEFPVLFKYRKLSRLAPVSKLVLRFARSDIQTAKTILIAESRLDWAFQRAHSG
jgi:hypothetical protein